MGWIETASLVLTKRETRTPMAFYSRSLWVITVIIGAPLYSNIAPEYKVAGASIGIVLFIALGIWVGIFAWKKPKFLLYGAETHLEEWKVERKQAGSGKSLTPRRTNEGAEGLVANE